MFGRQQRLNDWR